MFAKAWKRLRVKEQVGPIPKEVKKQLRWRHGLSQEELDRLRCATSRRRFAREIIMSVRIFDPTLLDYGSIIRAYKDLDGRPLALLFEGKWRKSGSKYSYFSDLRPGKGKKATVSIPPSENGLVDDLEVEDYDYQDKPLVEIQQ